MPHSTHVADRLDGVPLSKRIYGISPLYFGVDHLFSVDVLHTSAAHTAPPNRTVHTERNANGNVAPKAEFYVYGRYAQV